MAARFTWCRLMQPWHLLLVAALLGACHQSDEAPVATATSTDAVNTSDVPTPGWFNVAICLGSQCAIVDRDGKVLLPFANSYDDVARFPMRDTTLLKDHQGWQLFDVRSMKPIKAVGSEVHEALPGYFIFKRDDKFGLMDFQGTEIQAPRFDALRVGGQPGDSLRFMVFDMGDMHGLLDSHGSIVADAVYSDIDINQALDGHAGLILASKSDEHWLIDLKTGDQRQVDFDGLSSVNDGLMVASRSGGEQGVIDTHGKLVIPMAYHEVGLPNAGMMAFRKEQGALCGYMDYRGSEVISPRFQRCEPFGKQYALAWNDNGNEGAKAGFGLIDRTGTWHSAKRYDGVDQAGYSLDGNAIFVPGFITVYDLTGDHYAHAGLVDLDDGHEVISPAHLATGVLKRGLYLFTIPPEPATTERPGTLPPVGLTQGGRPLVEAGDYGMISLDKTGRYLHASSLVGDVEYLLDLKGHVLIKEAWERFVVNEPLGVIFGVEGDEGESRVVAAYDMAGAPLFKVGGASCGALIGRSGEAIWPQDHVSCAAGVRAAATPK